MIESELKLTKRLNNYRLRVTRKMPHLTKTLGMMRLVDEI